MTLFGELVRTHRLRRGFTQEDLAHQAGIAVRSIGKLENGSTARPRPTTVRLIADALGLQGRDRDGFLRAAAGPPTGVEAAAEPGPASAPGRPPDAVPAQLPADVRGFRGRSPALAELDTLLLEVTAPATGESCALVVAVVTGTAGVGKTALALHWAHRVRADFPDGQLYLNLRGFDPAGRVLDPFEALGRFLETLRVPPGQVPADVDARAALYRSLLAGRRILIVLDNARDAEQVRPLLPGSPGCLVLVTSRNALSSLVAGSGAHPIPLDLLPADDAAALLTDRVGAGRAGDDPDAVRRIVTACTRLPLALTIVGARAATHPQFPLAALARELEEARTPLVVLADPDPRADVRSVFSWSYRALGEAAARMFRCLGLHPGLDVSAAAAVSIAGLRPGQERPLLAELAQAHLIREHLPGRYVTHDLLRAYARELAHDPGVTQERDAAVARLLDHYLHSAHAATTRVVPARNRIELAPPLPGTTPEEFGDERDATAWLATELPVLVDVITLAADRGFDRATWQLGWVVSRFCELGSHWQEGAAVQELAIAAAQRLGDADARALLHRSLGRAYGWLGRHDDAEEHLHQAIALSAERGDHLGQANGYGSLSWVLGLRNRHHEALRAAESALELNRSAGSVIGEANALNLVGWTWSQLGDHTRAIAHCEQALGLFEQLGDRFSTAHTYDSLGRARHHLGQSAEALACYGRALELYRGFGHRFFEAETLDHLGDTHHAAGQDAAACWAYDQALAILDDLGHPLAGQVRNKRAQVQTAAR